MNIEQLSKELGITARGQRGDDNTYTINIKDSNEYGRYESLLYKSDLLEVLDESSYVTADNANLDYKYENQYILSLIADFDEDLYKLVIIEME